MSTSRDAETPGGESGVPADLRKIWRRPWQEIEQLGEMCQMLEERAENAETELAARSDNESWRAMHATIDRLERELARARAPYHECLSLTYMSGDRAEEALLRIRKSLAGSVGE